MESWSNGREQLLEQLTKVCDQIGSNLQAELSNDNFTRIGREELELLRKNSASVGSVNEHNQRLVEDIEKFRAVANRVDGLEQENKRLAAELQQQIQARQSIAATPRRLAPEGSSKSTPAAIPPSSASRIDYDEGQPVAPEKYQSLVLKYNHLCEEFKAVKQARKTFEDRFRAEVEKNKGWNVFIGEKDKRIAKKDEKIKRLEAEVKSLKEAQGFGTSTPAENRPASILPALSTKQSFHEHAHVEIPQSSPIKSADAPTNEVVELELGAFEEGNGGAVEEELDTVDLPRHRLKPVQVEETQFVGLEEHHTSSTEGDTDPVSPLADTDENTPDLLARRSPSPETPIVISSRSLKKRKAPHECTQATPVSKVKAEVITSSPIGLAHFLPRNESLDLDDIGEKVDTPRKHRRLQEELSRQNSRDPLQSLSSTNYLDGNRGQSRSELNVSTLNNTVNNTPIRATTSVLQSRSTNQKILPRTSEGSAPKKRRIASNKDVETLMEDGEFVTPTRGNGQNLKQGELLIDLLTKPSPPRQAISPTRAYAVNQQPAGLYRTTTTSGLAREITRLPPQGSVSRSSLTRRQDDSLVKPKAKDSRDINDRSPTSSRPSSRGSVAGQIESSRPSSRDTSRTSVEPPVSRGSKRGSLEPMANSRISPRKSKASVPRTSDTPGQSPPPSTLDRLLPPRRDLPSMFTPKLVNMQGPITITKSPTKTKDDTASARKIRQPKTNNMSLADWEMDPEQEPLRSRPVEKLSLQDFKVNASYNQGHDYAFREVVRGKDARHALQGCTKPDCCGSKFRALAEINSANAPTLSQEERDDGLLRDYMGDNYYKLRNMSEVDRHEILLQAKTREISERHGKHRHAYVRPASPPGFWSNDFPTTQEQRADMEKVKEKERALVLERYNEAMRPGGKYIFRDE